MGDDTNKKRITSPLQASQSSGNSSRADTLIGGLSDRLSSYDIEDYRRTAGNDDERFLDNRPPHWG